MYTFLGLLPGGRGQSTLAGTPSAAGSVWGLRTGRLSRELLLFGEAPAWGLGGSWHRATLQLAGRGGWVVVGGDGWQADSYSSCCLCLKPPTHCPRGVPWVAGGPPSKQGTGVLGGDAEHKKSGKNDTNSKVILLDVGVDNSAALVPIVQIGKQKPREAQELAGAPTANQMAAGSRSQARLEGWGARGSLLGIDFRAGNPRV